MKKLIICFTALLLHFVSFSQTIPDKLNEYFIAAQKAELFNGSVLVAEKGQLLLNKGYGYKNVVDKSLNDPNTIYQIGSVTKQFTATIILKLAEQKKLALDDKLTKYFPNLPNADKITIENLLAHTSGIWNYTKDQDFMRTGVEKPRDELGMLSLFKDKPLDFEPGAKYSYSNSGYVLLGYIIEKVTGKKYESVVREQIFQPLKMANSGFDFTHLASPDKATGYLALTTGNSTKSLIVDSSISFSAGAIYTTLDDLYKWDQSLSTEKILTKASLDNAFTPRLDNYGLGWSIYTVAGKKVVTHDGGIHGFLSHNSIIPSDDISITILSNSGSSSMNQLSKDVLAIVYKQPYKLPEVIKEIKVDINIMKKYVGEYELTPTFKIVVSILDGGLKAQATGQPQFDLFAKDENNFFLKVVDAQVEFVKNDKGEVDKLILHQNGAHQPAKKVK
jgi:CubicO group peptidase (beta-lactamase class C family)